jgi:hypothetical protein
MNSLLEKITEWIKEALIGGITTNFTGMFDMVNQKVGEIAGQVGQTPESFNSGVFSMIRSLSETVVIPIAGMILTFILCYELIHMIIDRNNMHDFETWIFFKWIFKTFCAVYILTHTFDIVMAVFALAQNAVNQSAGIIGGSLDMNLALADLATQLEAMEWYTLLGLYLESAIVNLVMQAISVCVFIVVYGRMIEIYLTVSVAPIPFSTMANREWGSMGNNYLKSLFALAFQGFLIMVLVAIYAVLIQGITAAGNIHIAIWECVGYTALLCFSLLKSGAFAKGVFQAH